MVDDVKYNPNGESSSSVSVISYEIEKYLVSGANEETIKERINNSKESQGFPPNLEYIDSFYDEKTGTSGSAFLDKNTGEIVLGYAGTNVQADGIKDIITDATLVAGSTKHCSAAVKFYEKIAAQGRPITVTGHSLGGNIAVVVALVTNNPRTITYNGAPLNASTYLYGLIISAKLNKYEKGKLLAKLVENQVLFMELVKKFKGNVTRIVSDQDPLNIVAKIGNAKYIGNEYIIYSGNGHSGPLFLNEDMQKYLGIILEIEKNGRYMGDITVDVMKDGSISVTREAKQLVVKNLLGNITGGGSGSSDKIKVDSDSLKYLSINLEIMANGDLNWIDENISKCETKNDSIISSFESRKGDLEDNVVDGLKNSGLTSLLRGIDDSFGEIKNKKGSLVSLENFTVDVVGKLGMDRASSYTTHGHNSTSYTLRRWYKGSQVWTVGDAHSFENKMKKIQEACQLLVQHINQSGKGSIEYYNASAGKQIFNYTSLSEISEAIVNITNGLEPKIKKTFKGLGLRSGKSDGISQALTDVFNAQHQNVAELVTSVNNLSSLAANVSSNYAQRDNWLQNSIQNGDMSGAPDAVSVPSSYKAYLEETSIFDDVSSVLSAFETQVEERSEKLAKNIADSYTSILSDISSKATLIEKGLNKLKKAINDIYDDLDMEITCEEMTETVTTLQPTGGAMPSASSQKKSFNTNRISKGALGSHLPGSVRSDIETVKNTILPLMDIFNAVLMASQAFDSGVNSMSGYLKSVVEKSVYTAFELDTIVQVQMLNNEVIQRMQSEMSNLNSSLMSENLGLAIRNMSSQVNSVAQLLGYFSNLISDCFGGGSSSGASSGKSMKANSYAGTF